MPSADLADGAVHGTFFFFGRGSSKHLVFLLDLARLVFPSWACTGLWTGLQNFDRIFWNAIASSVKVPVDFLKIGNEKPEQPCS